MKKSLVLILEPVIGAYLNPFLFVNIKSPWPSVATKHEYS